MTDTRSAVVAFFRDVLTIDVNDPSEDLIEQGRLDSLGLVELLFFLEQRFGFTVDLASLDTEQLRSVDAICTLIESGPSSTGRPS